MWTGFDELVALSGGNRCQQKINNGLWSWLTRQLLIEPFLISNLLWITTSEHFFVTVQRQSVWRHLFLKAQHCHHYIHGITSASRMDAENCRLSLGVQRRLKCYDDSSRPWHRTKTTRLVRNFSQQALFVFWRATHAVRIFKLFTFCFESQSDVGKKIPASKLYCPEFHLSGITQACPVTLGQAAEAIYSLKVWLK